MLRFFRSDSEISAHAEPKFAAFARERPKSFTGHSRQKVGPFGSFLPLSTTRSRSLFVAVSLSSVRAQIVEKLARNPPAR